MKKHLLKFVAALLLSLTQAASAGSPIWQPGFIILAKDRFDPAIQRLIADHSLRSLPLERGQLYYVYPVGIDPYIEGAQIRYLEALLEKRAFQEQQSEPDQQ